MSNGDSYLFAESEDPQHDETPFVSKRLLWVSDQNSSSQYSGQIQWDLSSLANSGGWLSFSEAWLAIPFSISMKTTGANVEAIPNAWCVGMKNGFFQLIDSISVQYNGSTVVQQTSLSNLHINWRVLSKWSSGDLQKYGPSLCVSPDTAGSYAAHGNTASVDGIGYTNNQPVAPGNIAWATTGLDFANTGYLQRLRYTSFGDGSVTANGPGGLGVAVAGSNAATNLNQNGSNYMYDSGNGANRVWQWNMVANIRLKDVCDFFDQIPLVRGANIQLVVNYNSTQVTDTVTTGPPITQTCAITQLTGNTCPYMISSAAALNPFKDLITSALTISSGVKQPPANAIAANSLLSQCRCYVPAYELDPVYEQRLLSSPQKVIEYCDIMQFKSSGIGAGQQVNALVTNNIISPEYLLVCPIISNSNAAVFAGSNPMYQNPFDSCPGTLSPQMALTSTNVALSGSWIYPQLLDYGFTEYLSEVAGMLALNGGKMDGLTSGLISQYMWQNAYGYYVYDLSRRSPAENGVGKSIQFQGVNSSLVTIDLVYFVAYKRKIVINLETGALMASTA